MSTITVVRTPLSAMAKLNAIGLVVAAVGVGVPLFLLVGNAIAIPNEDEPGRTDVVGLIGTVMLGLGLVVALIAGLQVLRQLRSRAGRE